MLSSALAKANTAVQLDNAENYEGAMEAYGDACVLLGQVMMRAGGDDDKKKLQAIVRPPIYPQLFERPPLKLQTWRWDEMLLGSYGMGLIGGAK